MVNIEKPEMKMQRFGPLRLSWAYQIVHKQKWPSPSCYETENERVLGSMSMTNLMFGY